MFKKVLGVLLGLSLLGLFACSQKEGVNTVSVGTIAGPETQLMEVAKKVAKKRYGLNIKIVTFTDYLTPNIALNEGSIDANAFQHLPYLKAQVKMHRYKIIPVAKTFLYPMALYSQKINKLSQLKEGAKVAIPNDPSNEARALLLLQNAKLIRLRHGAGINATPLDVVENPKKLKFVALDAAELPRVLDDVAIAAINTNYAVPSGLSPSKDALFVESAKSPYTNIIAIRPGEKNAKKIKELVASFQSEPVVKEAKKLFGDAAIPGFKVKTPKF
jgi:D-methionine transport system substrate-binding protein